MQKKIGIMLSEFAHWNMPVLFQAGGLDFFILDAEHGAFDYADMSRVIMSARLAGIFVLVRIPDNTRRDIIKVLDMGADGILLPMTDTARDIEKAVEYAKYRPVGKRGISTMRAHTLYAPPPIGEYMRAANGRVHIFAQIETAKGLENSESILKTPGVSGCFLGPNDLSDDLGCLGKACAEEIISAIGDIGSIARRTGKAAGIITGNIEYLRCAARAGYLYFSRGSELNAIKEYCQYSAGLITAEK